VIKGFTGTLSFFGVVFSKRKRMKEAIREIIPTTMT
jgi:hypothetical protein